MNKNVYLFAMAPMALNLVLGADDSGYSEEMLWTQCKDLRALYEKVSAMSEKGDVAAMGGQGAILAFMMPDKYAEQGLIRLKQASVEGDVPSIRYLGICYLYGIGDKVDEKKGIELLKLAEEKGDTQSTEVLSRAYLCFEETRDLQEALKYAQKATAHDNGKSLVYMGDYLVTKIKNNELAFQCFQQAAELGNAKATCELAKCLYGGIGCSKDVEKAKDVLEPIADVYTPARNILFRLYLATSEHKKCVELATKYAEQEEEDFAQAILASCYHSGGKDVARDIDKAIYWGEKAAKQDNIIAIYILIEAYRAKMDTEQMMKWMHRGAKLGDSFWQSNLATAYLRGIHVEKNLHQAAYWLKKSLDQKEPRSLEIMNGIEQYRDAGDKDMETMLSIMGELETDTLMPIIAIPTIKSY